MNSPLKMAIVVARFNSDVTELLLERALQGFREQNIEPLVLSVPGAVEIPLAIQRLIAQEELDGVVALGCVIQGETRHYEEVCRICSDGLMRVMLDTDTPIVFEVLMVDDKQKALDRLDKAYHAAFVATEMAEL